MALGQGDYKQNINFKRQMRADTATLQLVMLPNLSLPTATAYPLLRDTATGKIYKDTCGYWRKCDTLPFWSTSGNTLGDTGYFIGTNDAQDFVVKTNNVERARFFSNGVISIGTNQQQYDVTIASGNVGALNSFGFISNRSTGTDAYIHMSMQDSSGIIGASSGAKSLEINVTSGGPVVFQNSGGSVGINTATPTSKLHVNGDLRIEGRDSVTIYALTPAAGTFQYCTDCTGNGITGRLLGYIGAAWRRFTIE